MNVFVTGGAGYIGSVVVEALLAQGHAVVIFDNLSEGHRDAVPAGATLIEGTLLDGAAVLGALREHKIDAVCHLAAETVISRSMVAPASTFSTNVTGTLELLTAMAEADVSRIVFSSTAAVYGEPEQVPITEESPLAPINPYGESKVMGERLLRWFHTAHGIRSVSLRYFNAAGASELNGEDHDPETHLIPNILKSVTGNGQPLSIFGTDYPTRDGTAVRDYVHIQDIADAHLAALERVADLGCVSVNLGSGDGLSVMEVVHATEQVVGHEIARVTGDRRPGDPAVLLASNDKARELLGWTPKRSTAEQILSSAWRWHQAHPAGYNS